MPADLVTQINDQSFIKLKPYALGLVKLAIFDRDVELPKNTRASLAGCEGYKLLMKLRNDAHAALTAAPPSAMQSLFAATGPPAKRKKAAAKWNAGTLKSLRDVPEIFEFEVPGTPPLLISAVKPTHPLDELQVRLDPDTLHHVMTFIRSKPVTLHDLTDFRKYRQHSEGWAMGSGRVLRKMEPSPSDDLADGLARQRFQVVKGEDTEVAENHVASSGEGSDEELDHGGVELAEPPEETSPAVKPDDLKRGADA